NMNTEKKKEAGFSLVELLIYIAIFATSSTFLIAILTSVTRIQMRQGSVNTVNRQIRFVTEVIERKVGESSAIDMALGESISEIRLRMPAVADDPTRIYLEGGRIFLGEGAKSPIAITDASVVVDNFRAARLENPGGRAIVQTVLALSFNTENPKAKFARVIELAMTRISAANFDSDLVPTGSGLNLGTETSRWRDGYFSGAVGIGVNPGAGLKLSVGGNAEITGAGNGLFLRSPDGTCYKLKVANGGGVITGSCL
ncbi:MAG: prepilin-type N-terminal cleavage/methylation domain-containing protein, partial [Nanoarchaeota archaeon]|nr:prepilin-type N-terminal cleavage/methylation domain-containing protein [Nanoarchaeota archaeon]